MQAAEVLGINVNEVHPKAGDTDEIGYTAVSGGSRTTYATGIAAIEAAQDVIGQMKGRAALLLEASDDDIEFADGSFTSKSNPGSSLTFKQVAEKLRGTGGFVIGQASVDPTGAGGAFAVHMADVEVDPETGKTEVLRYTAIQDAGKAVHPSYVEGQMQGGEVPIVPPLPTLANAIQKATGTRITQLPMNPGRVLENILSGQNGNAGSA